MKPFISFLKLLLPLLSFRLFTLPPSASAQPVQEISHSPALLSFQVPSSSNQLFHLPPPQSPSQTFITLNICSAPIPSPQFSYQLVLIVSNSSLNPFPNEDSLPTNSRGLIPQNLLAVTGDYSHAHAGFANVTVQNSLGLWINVLAPEIDDQQHANWTFQLGLSTSAPLHAVNGFPAFKLEDTDDTSALLTAADSSLFMPITAAEPLSMTQFAPLILPTPSSLALGLSASFCALQRLNSSITFSQPPIAASLTTRGTGAGMSSSQPGINSSDHDFRISDEAAGKRTQYLLSGLQPAQNYTAWLVQPTGSLDGIQTGKLWPYINFRTKSSRNCRLVHDVPFCPSVAYAVPSPPETSTATLLAGYNSSVSSNLTSFATVLATYPCNNDTSGRYSFVSGCGDCRRAYWDWLCGVVMPRCTDAPAKATPNPSLPGGAQQVFSIGNQASSRTPQLGQNAFPYGEIPPCGSTCTLVAATCPPLVGWQCPLPGVTAERSYGNPAILSGVEVMGGEQTGAGGGGERAGDRFGNVYCNALGSDLAYARQGTGGQSAQLSRWSWVPVGLSISWMLLGVGSSSLIL